MKKTYNCLICNLEFDSFSKKANHVRWYHKDNTEYIKNSSLAAIELNAKRFGYPIKEDVFCYKCGNGIKIEYRPGKKKEKYFCSRSCANSRIRDENFKAKVSISIQDLWANGHYDSTSALNHLKLKKQFSSKREREILKYFKENFPVDDWKSGGQLKYNNMRLSRDMYSDKLKICFEYDGEWHFRDIKGQLEEKNLKDCALEKWCCDNQYRLIRIDEAENLTISEIVNLIYNSIDNILKIGKRYTKFD